MKKFSVLIIFCCVLILGASSVFATSVNTSDAKNYSGKEIDDILSSITPYVALNSSNLATIDENAAKKEGIKQKDIVLAQKYFAYQNDYVSRTLKGESIENIKLDQDFYNQFGKYFQYLTKEKYKDKPQPTEEGMYALAICGTASVLFPDTCPDREVMNAETTLSAAQTFAYDSGYHRTAAYAGGGEADSPARDFTKGVSANGCWKNVYRNQMVISDLGTGYYKVLRQQVEPNPEIHSYFHPTATWAAYVLWWHQYYC